MVDASNQSSSDPNLLPGRGVRLQPDFSPEPIGMAMLLRRAREQRGLTLEQVADETKVPLEQLEALERDALPHINRGFYQRAHIRAYARAVDLDERVVLAELKREAASAIPPPVPQPLPVRTRSLHAPQIAMLVVRGSIVVVISVGISAVVWDASTARGTNDHAAIAASPEPERDAAATTGDASEVAQSAPQAAASTLLAAEPTPPVAVQDVAMTEPEAPRGSTTTPAVTELVITTDPVEARVVVNGIGWGSTPITIRHLAPGEKRLRVTKDGYMAVEQVTHVAADQSTTVNIQLQPSP